MEDSVARRWILHHELHQQWGKESLYFFRLSFSPTYNRSLILQKLAKVFAKLEILSFTAYESTGQYDLYLRLWLPAPVAQNRFETELYEELASCYLQICEPFSVSKIHSHWVWENGDSETRMVHPDPATVVKGLTDEELQMLNDDTLSDSELQRYVDLNLARLFRPRNGIRLIVLIPRSPMPLSVSAGGSLASSLYSALPTLNTFTMFRCIRGMALPSS